MQAKSNCTVLLSFDVDAESLWMSYGMVSPTPMSRGTYGARVGLPRVLDLLRDRNLPATFFVPAETARRHPEGIRRIVDEGHELGHHGDIHEQPALLSEEQERRMLEVGIDTLQAISGVRPRGYRSPSWDFGKNTLRLLKEYGFAWDSSLMGDDFQLYPVEEDQLDNGLIEVPVSWELDDAAHFLFNSMPYATGMACPDKVLRMWKTEFDGAYDNGGVFVLTMHPEIIGRWHRLKMLEQLLDYIQSRTGVTFSCFSPLVDQYRTRTA